MSGGRYIVLGDRTSHGGEVISGHAGKTIDGIPVATVGCLVTCPKCGGTHEIVSGSESASYLGLALAREDDVTSCGATLISGGQSRSTVDG
ncbi:MAG: PAAR domain-containing protein [Azoarcus sp.]|jgi:uncharacterized Zn-binding protein involved in type VI secretion|nr:PAAR domain-containing protein [Azoarcus sp.]